MCVTYAKNSSTGLLSSLTEKKVRRCTDRLSVVQLKEVGTGIKKFICEQVTYNSKRDTPPPIPILTPVHHLTQLKPHPSPLSPPHPIIRPSTLVPLFPDAIPSSTIRIVFSEYPLRCRAAAAAAASNRVCCAAGR